MVHFVGAGPGAVDLITVRGAEHLRAADLVIYAGSLVNTALLDTYCQPACERRDSARMTLEEVVEAMREADALGKKIVRLHTGDPSVYGAIKEQMDALAALTIEYDVTPGVSAFSASAASLHTEFTLPDVSQTLVITRMPGRTPVPDGEDMAALASHRASMAIYLSAGLTEALQEKLTEGGYPETTPAAIVYKASWEDEKIVRCTVGTLSDAARNNGISRTATILVGNFLNADYSRSKLYHPFFSHGFREGTVKA